MTKISTLRKVFCVGFAVLLAFATLPVAMVSNANAAQTCTDGITTWRDLQDAVGRSQRLTNIKLCDDITMTGSLTFETNVSEYRATLNLNGHNLTRGANQTAITVNSNAYLTIVGSGKVTGRLSAQNASGSSRLTIAGGTYTSNPSSYIKDNTLSAYHVGNEYRVETKLTASNISVTPVKVRVGGTAEIAVTKPADSTTGFTYVSADRNTARVSNTGVVTGVKVGTTTVAVTTTHRPAVTKTVDVEVLPVLTSVSADDIMVKAGNSADITNIVVADASIKPTFSYASNDESIATVDENGKVTGQANGKTTVTITATYVDAVGTMTVTGDVNVTVF